jgi:hypothetical protein
VRKVTIMRAEGKRRREACEEGKRREAHVEGKRRKVACEEGKRRREECEEREG